MIYGLLLILFIIYMPKGILGTMLEMAREEGRTPISPSFPSPRRGEGGGGGRQSAKPGERVFLKPSAGSASLPAAYAGDPLPQAGEGKERAVRVAILRDRNAYVDC